jgi:hypothetical protein
MTNVKKWAVVSGQWAGVAPLNFSGFSFRRFSVWLCNFCFLLSQFLLWQLCFSNQAAALGRFTNNFAKGSGDRPAGHRDPVRPRLCCCLQAYALSHTVFRPFSRPIL